MYLLGSVHRFHCSTLGHTGIDAQFPKSSFGEDCDHHMGNLGSAIKAKVLRTNHRPRFPVRGSVGFEALTPTILASFMRQRIKHGRVSRPTASPRGW